ncbi:unnamed protein product [Darwinula stevensoni]|uniref:Tr-type G domain-containing protein n=1 Tax=Darwinula stevensoni TaxID=69355 RepID=A0A7R8X053_9CRUS|nr:unnamed protein product [Darwinula stevensoni]CAG0878571.1 unnamed protein product [Darwinula stevensoni]
MVPIDIVSRAVRYSGSLGVEAQTLTVWKQADRYGIPRLGYLNKMDKRGADIRMCLESMAKKLHCLPLLTQVPIGAEKSFSGLVDVVDLQVHSWQSPQGWTRTPLDSDESIADSADIWDAREKLVESLTDVDDVLAERLIELENSRALSNEEIKAALRRATISMVSGPAHSYHCFTASAKRTNLFFTLRIPFIVRLSVRYWRLSYELLF